MSDGEEDLSDVEQEDEKEEIPDFPLTEDLVGENLSLLCKTSNGLAHAYVRLDLHDKQVTDISVLSCYIHLRYLDLSENSLREISALNALTHLLTLKVDNNLLTSPELSELPYLQVASFANNRISTTKGVTHPSLEHLNLNGNQILEVTDLDKLDKLQTLELRSNQLTSTTGIEDLPSLRKLYLAANNITLLDGLNTLVSLQFLHLRNNKLITLDGFTDQMVNLQYINLRDNEGMQQLSEVAKLQCLPNLRALLLKGCTVEDTPDYRTEVLVNVRRLERLDKDPYTEDERLDAEQIAETRKEEAAAARQDDSEATGSQD